MKYVKAIILFIFISSCLTAQTINDYTGVWQGLGYIKSGEERNAFTAKLIVKNTSSKNTTVKGEFFFVPNNDEVNFAGVYDFSFEGIIKEGKLLVESSTVEPEYERGGERVFQYIADGQQPKLFGEFFNDTWKDYEIIWLLTKTSEQNDVGVSESKLEECFFAENEKFKKENPERFTSEIFLKENAEKFNENRKNCLLNQLNLKDIKYSYILFPSILVIEIKGIEPIYFIMEKTKADAIIKNKNSTVFEFSDFVDVNNNEEAYIPFIYPYKVTVTNSVANFSDTYPNQKFKNFGREGSPLPTYIAQYRPMKVSDGAGTIDSKLITLPSDKEFRWMDWEDVPEMIKEATKQVKSFGTTTLYENIQDDLDGYGSPQGGCKVKVALTDLNENGIYGFAVSSSGSPACCGYAGRGCSYTFLEDGGVFYNELGQDHNVTPSQNTVISSVGKEFKFKTNTKIDSQTKEKLLQYFKYK